MAYWIVKVLLTPIIRFFYDVKVEGLENIPAEGPAILASNHLSFCDSIFLPLVLRRRLTFVAKAEYFDDPKTAWFFRAVGQIPIRRDGGDASQGALLAAKDVLEAGGLFGIYPEGTRSPDGRLHKGHTGVARLAMQAQVPVIPVAMIGTREAQPIGRKPRPFVPITIRIGKPVEVKGRSLDDRLALRDVTDEVMFELRELSGQEYVHRYAKRGSAETAEAGAAAPSHVVAVAPPPDALLATR